MLKKCKLWVIRQEHLDAHDFSVPLIESPFIKIWEGEAYSSFYLANEIDPDMHFYILKAEEHV